MRPYLADILNRAFGTGVFTYLLPNYLILLCAGALVGTVYAARRARARGLNPEVFYGLVLWALPAALLGGRVMGFLYAPESYGGSLLALLDPLRGDSAAYGGFIGGTLAGVGYLLARRVEVWRFLDCAGPPLGVATAFTRVGCFLDGCDFGSPTASALGVCFPAGSPAHAEQVSQGLIAPGALFSLPVHPVQLYLALNGLLLAAVTAWWSRRRTRPPGEAFLGYWALYAVARSGLELLRGDAERKFLGPLSTSQAVSIPVVLLAVGLIGLRRRKTGGTTGAGEACMAESDAGRAPVEEAMGARPEAEPPAGRAARGAALEAVLATVAAALAVRLCLARGEGGAGGWWAALAPAVWIYAPLAVLLLRRLPLEPHGFSAAAWTRGAGTLLAAAAAVLVPFAGAVAAWRWIGGLPAGFQPGRLLSWEPLWQLALVAVPEEVFFRGYAQARLRAWAAARGAAGAGVQAFPVLAGAVLFAAAHLIARPGWPGGAGWTWAPAAVFFPGLVLRWLRERTGGLLAPAGFHWLANLTAIAVGWGGAP